MRKYVICIFMCALVVTCSNEEDVYDVEDNRVIVRASIISDETRANPLSTSSTTQAAFNSGDTIMISDDGSAFAAYTLTNDEWTASTYLTWNSLAFYAYYPQSAQYHLYELVTTQTSNANLLSADYMRWSKTYSTIPSNHTIDIEMARQTALVRVKVSSITSTNGTGPSIKDYHIYSPHVAIRHGVPIGSTGKVTPYIEKNSDGDTVYSALVIPYSDDDTTADFADEYFIDFDVSDTYNDSTRTTTVYYKGIPELKAGYSYTIYVTITINN